MKIAHGVDRQWLIELGPGLCHDVAHHFATRFGVNMNFHTRKWVKPEDLNPNGTLFGRTSITLTCEVRNKITRKSILTVEKMVFVNLGEDGLPAPHGRTEIKYVKDQFQSEGLGE